MDALKARVVNGRYVIEQNADLPEGTEIYLVPAHDAADRAFVLDDGLTEQERSQIHQGIVASIRDRRAGGSTFDADEVMAELAPRS